MIPGWRDRIAFRLEHFWRTNVPGRRLLEILLFAEAGTNYSGRPMLRNRINGHVVFTDERQQPS